MPRMGLMIEAEVGITLPRVIFSPHSLTTQIRNFISRVRHGLEITVLCIAPPKQVMLMGLRAGLETVRQVTDIKKLNMRILDGRLTLDISLQDGVSLLQAHRSRPFTVHGLVEQ